MIEAAYSTSNQQPPAPSFSHDNVACMLSAQQDQPPRREVIVGLGAVAVSSALPLELRAESAASPLCFTSAVEIAAMIRAKKLSARGGRAGDLKRNGCGHPPVNALVP